MAAVKKIKKIAAISSTQLIILGFLVVIFIGAFLLSLPISSSSGLSTPFIDALFTASSAVCVTGLVVVNTAQHWSTFGQTVIILLIQVGGLGFMTILTMFFIMTKKKITLKERLLLQESLNQTAISGMVALVLKIVKGTLLFELTGALILSIRFVPDFGILNGICMGIFHSISAFCNAGFDIIGDSSIIPYNTDIIINLVLCTLIIVGGLGFTVWSDVLHVFKANKGLKKESFKLKLRHLSTHSKVVFTITIILLLFGTVFFFLSEYNNPATMGDKNILEKAIMSATQSVTTRTAGFDSVGQGSLTYHSKFMTILLMFIGGSPGGTAGGIKTTTIGVIIIAVISVIKGSHKTNVFGRNISFETLQKSLAIFMISVTALVGITMLISVTEANISYDYEFIDLLFEVSSALGTVGLTTGITPHLSAAGKVIISIAMFMGRLGPITIAIALTGRQNRNKTKIDYPMGRIIVG